MERKLQKTDIAVLDSHREALTDANTQIQVAQMAGQSAMGAYNKQLAKICQRLKIDPQTNRVAYVQERGLLEVTPVDKEGKPTTKAKAKAKPKVEDAQPEDKV